MTRWLAGSFGAGRAPDASRLPGAIAGQPAALVRAGALVASHTGAPALSREPLCLLDGYLDNAAELAASVELPAGSDSELVLARAWQRLGTAMLARLRGEFALLIWDEHRQEGLLARDQLGVRSLFLSDHGGVLHFASEVRDLIELLPVSPGPDTAGVAHWITLSTPAGTGTMYERIRRMAPGTALVLSLAGARPLTYWQPRFAQPLDEGEPALAERVRAELERAVSLRIAAEGSTGVLMSGGLDSSSVAALAAAAAPGHVRAQAAVFPEHPAVDESELIDELRSSLGLPGLTAKVRAGGLLASALDSTAQWRLPLRSWGDFWARPLLAGAAAHGVTVTLGGDGGDELFGVRDHLIADRMAGGHPLRALALVRELPGAGDHPSRREIARIYRHTALAGSMPLAAHRLARRLTASSEEDSLLLASSAAALADDEPYEWKQLDGPRWWSQAAHGLTRGAERTGVFEHQRRRAASVGLQARHPLFDLDLVELCLRLPPRATFDRHLSRPQLRAAMSGLLPDAVRLRPQKALFDTLLMDSLTGTDLVLARELLCGPRAQIRAHVDQATMERTLFQHGGGPTSFRVLWQLWRLTTAEIWLRSLAGEDLGEVGARAAQASVEIADAP